MKLSKAHTNFEERHPIRRIFNFNLDIYTTSINSHMGLILKIFQENRAFLVLVIEISHIFLVSLLPSYHLPAIPATIEPEAGSIITNCRYISKFRLSFRCIQLFDQLKQKMISLPYKSKEMP